MKVKGNPLVVILILVLVDFASSLRANHEIQISRKCSEIYPGSKPLKSSDQYLEARNPGRDDWNWLYVQNLQNQVTPGDYSYCFLFENNKLYLINKNGRKVGTILANRRVDYNDWEWAFVGDDVYMNDNPSRYFGAIYTESCTVPGTVKIVSNQYYEGKYYISYLVSTDSMSSSGRYGYIGTKFVGAGLAQKGKFPDEHYCFKL